MQINILFIENVINNKDMFNIVLHNRKDSFERLIGLFYLKI